MGLGVVAMESFKWTEVRDRERNKNYQILRNKLAGLRRYQIACERILKAKSLETAKGIAKSVLDLNIC